MVEKVVEYKCEFCGDTYEDKIDATRCELVHKEEDEER